MAYELNRKRLPPYISYRTFYNFIEGLEQGIPARIDRSYWGDKFSGSTGTQLLGALRFLGLTDSNNVPTNRLRELVSHRDSHRADILRQVCTDAYIFLLGSSFDPQQATFAQLNELFHNTYQLADDVARKCIKFFIELSTAADIPLSPFILKKSRTMRGTTGTKKIVKRTDKRTTRNLQVPATTEKIPEQTSTWDEMLLAKFPPFDPNWSDELKVKWFAGFDELLKRGNGKDGDTTQP
ncbi:MAG: DUF5343 domain-containing protein [Chloroflexota bacterium]